MSVSLGDFINFSRSLHACSSNNIISLSLFLLANGKVAHTYVKESKISLNLIVKTYFIG